jgi:hypothetical protein
MKQILLGDIRVPKKFQDLLRDELLISCKVALAKAKSLFQSEGKAQLIQDLHG